MDYDEIARTSVGRSYVRVASALDESASARATRVQALPPPTRIAHPPILGFWEHLRGKQSSPEWEIPCPGRR